MGTINSTKQSLGFETCKTPEDVKQYLQMVLTRPSESKDTTYVFRYTKIKYLIDMLKTGYMRLGPCADMNDDFETAVLRRHGVLNRLFYACFTKVDESLAMYKLYGIDQDSVIFRISYADLEKFITEKADDSGDKYAPFHNFRGLRNNIPVEGLAYRGKAYCTAVGYYDPRKNEIKSGTKENKSIHGPFNKPELAGKVKYGCWAYEDEIRLCGETETPLPDNECLAIELPSGFESMISVILCPGFDKTKNMQYLIDLQIRGINCSDSVYDPIYSDFISSERNKPENVVNEYRDSYGILKGSTQCILEIYTGIQRNPTKVGKAMYDNTSTILEEIGNRFGEFSSFDSPGYIDIPNPEQLKDISVLLIKLSQRIILYKSEIEENLITADKVIIEKIINSLGLNAL